MDMELVVDVLHFATVAVGALSALASALDALVKRTPTDTDDVALGHAKRFLGQAADFLGNFSFLRGKR